MWVSPGVIVPIVRGVAPSGIEHGLKQGIAVLVENATE
jgi:hypothetical protein